MTYTKNRRDANEADIVAVWTGVGCGLVQGKPGQGFDWLVLYRGLLHIVEIKQLSERNHLTQAERDMQDDAESRGIAYNVICTVQEAEKLIGLEIE